MEAADYKLPLGASAPDFRDLPGVDGRRYSLSGFADARVLVVFWHCNHCPYAKAFEARLNQVALDYRPRGVALVAINSNDAQEYPEDSFENMARHAKEARLAFPYVYDESQQVAEAYGAQCTPHVFVFDAGRQLRYQGRVDGHKDEARGGNAADLRAALEALLAGRPVPEPLTRAFGCGIKWSAAHFARAGVGLR